MKMLTEQQIDLVNNTFGSAAALSTSAHHHDRRQHAWVILLSRSTSWDNPSRLRSQARNALLEATRTIARQAGFGRRSTLSALQWQAIPDDHAISLTDVVIADDTRSGLSSHWLLSDCRRSLTDDPELLGGRAKLLVRIRAIKTVRRYRKSQPLDYRQIRRMACAIAVEEHCSPGAETARDAYLDYAFDVLGGMSSLQ